jgi:Na+-translocating ferredoxin:NAD+ oxidoreductase subunit G
MIQSKAWMLGLLLILSIICSASLAFVTIKTGPFIRQNEETMRMMTVLNVFGVKFDKSNKTSIAETYRSLIAEESKNGLTLFHEKESGQTALEMSGSGFQSIITLVVALKGDTISGFKVVSQNETPGLGSRITEEAFQNQFIGKKVSEGITWVKTGHAGPSEFDAITGATESSKALTRILNRGFSSFFNIAAAPAIPKEMEVKIMMSVLNMFGMNYSLQDSTAIRKSFKDTITETEEKGTRTYVDKKSGTVAILVAGSGYQSTIIALVGLKNDTISGFKVVSQNETSGLGSRIAENTFQNQFVGKKVSNGIKMVKTGHAGPTEFDAISRSTVSSEAVERMLNNGFRAHYHLQTEQAASTSGEIPPKAGETTAQNQEAAAQAGEKAALSDEMKRLTAVLDVFGIPYSVQDSLAVKKSYQEHIAETKEKGLIIFREKGSGASALCLTGKGYQDNITVVVALKGNTISRFRVMSQNETEGMGARIAEDSFQNQFTGKDIGHGITLVKTGKAGPSEFDALTGATVTSEAIAGILNDGFRKYLNITVEPAAAKAEETAPQEKEGAAEQQEVTPIHPETKRMAAMLGFYGISADLGDSAAVRKSYDENIVESNENGLRVFHKKGSKITALYLSGEGFQDTITVAVALKNDTIKGFAVVYQNETRSIGTRITEKAFQKQFIGKKVAGGITMVTEGKAGESQFDAISGATVSSTAVAKLLNDGFARYFQSGSGGK